LDENLEHSDETKPEHAYREPDSRFQLLEDDVGRDLEQDIRNEEDNKRVVIFRARETQLFRKSKDIGVCNVHTVQKCQQVHYTQPRNDMEVNLPEQLGLRRMRRALDEFWRFILLMHISRLAVDTVAWRLDGFYIELVSSVS
jgi:hypothetical protein